MTTAVQSSTDPYRGLLRVSCVINSIHDYRELLTTLLQITKEVMKRAREIKQEEEELRADFNQTRNEEMGKLQKSISEAIQSLAKEEHFDLILHEGVVFASDAINVTAKVASRLEVGGGSSKGSKK